MQSASHKLVARALQLIANGKDAAIACEELDQLPETQVWARVRDLQALVGEAREERKMLDSLALADPIPAIWDESTLRGTFSARGIAPTVSQGFGGYETTPPHP